MSLVRQRPQLHGSNSTCTGNILFQNKHQIANFIIFISFSYFSLSVKVGKFSLIHLFRQDFGKVMDRSPLSFPNVPPWRKHLRRQSSRLSLQQEVIGDQCFQIGRVIRCCYNQSVVHNEFHFGEQCSQCELTEQSISYARGGRGGEVLPEKFGRGVRPAYQNLYPTYDQKLRYSLPYLWPDQKFETLFMTWPLNQNPVSDLRYN